MKVITAKSAGFCFGVKRAVDTVYEQIEKGGKIYTYGPVIHNETVVEDLEKKGAVVLNSEEELKSITDGTVILRSHGVSKEIYELLEERNIPFVDTACPFVKRIHRIVEKESGEGKQIVRQHLIYRNSKILLLFSKKKGIIIMLRILFVTQRKSVRQRRKKSQPKLMR